MRQKVLNIFFLLLFLPICFLFGSGSWDGEVILSDDAVPINTPITATITNLNYTPTDPTAIQELEDGKATITYEYFWTFSPGGIIESGQTSYCCTGKFSTASSSVGDKTIKVEVTAKVIYTESEEVVETDSNTKSKTVTVLALDHIKVSPSLLKIYCGQSYTFSAKGYDQFGNKFSLDDSKVSWNCDYGTMSPWNESTSSKFTAPTFPKINLKITITFDFTHNDIATVRIYPKIGEFKVDVSRTWDPYPAYFYARLSQNTLKDTYGHEWFSTSDYPFPRYEYFDCWDGSHYYDASAYTFPRKYDIPGVIQNGLNVTEYINIYFDGEEGDWPEVGYNFTSDGYTWSALNIFGNP